MTYRPVENPSGRGRKPIPVPETLLSQLRHSYDTGKRVVVDLDGIPEPDVADFLRALNRARYQHFADKSVHVRGPKNGRLTYWLADRRPVNSSKGRRHK